jgi:membrane protein YqaA with SNARE-associated domain
LPGQHLTAHAAYLHELTASVRAGNYGLILMAFPVIGLIMSLAAGARTRSVRSIN